MNRQVAKITTRAHARRKPAPGAGGNRTPAGRAARAPPFAIVSPPRGAAAGGAGGGRGRRAGGLRVRLRTGTISITGSHQIAISIFEAANSQRRPGPAPGESGSGTERERNSVPISPSHRRLFFPCSNRATLLSVEQRRCSPPCSANRARKTENPARLRARERARSRVP